MLSLHVAFSTFFYQRRYVDVKILLVSVQIKHIANLPHQRRHMQDQTKRMRILRADWGKRNIWHTTCKWNVLGSIVHFFSWQQAARHVLLGTSSNVKVRYTILKFFLRKVMVCMLSLIRCLMLSLNLFIVLYPSVVASRACSRSAVVKHSHSCDRTLIMFLYSCNVTWLNGSLLDSLKLQLSCRFNAFIPNLFYEQ